MIRLLPVLPSCRYMQSLSRRGLHRTALEVCKLLLALDSDDPLGALCTIDYLALRAGRWVQQAGSSVLHALPCMSACLVCLVRCEPQVLPLLRSNKGLPKFRAAAGTTSWTAWRSSMAGTAAWRSCPTWSSLWPWPAGTRSRVRLGANCSEVDTLILRSQHHLLLAGPGPLVPGAGWGWAGR